MTCWPTVAIHFGDLFYLPFLASSPSVNSDVKLTNLFKYHPLLSWQFCGKLLECDCSCSLVDITQTADRRFVVEHATTSRKKARHLNSLIFKMVIQDRQDFQPPQSILASIVGILFWGYFQCIQMQSALRLLIEYTYLIQIITAGALSFSFPDLVPKNSYP